MAMDADTFGILEPLNALALIDTNFTCDVPFTLNVQNLSTGDSLLYEWSVVGPNANNVLFNPTAIEPQFIFQDTGVFIIKLRVYNDVCGESFWMDTLQILPKPDVNLIGFDQFCEQVLLTPMVFYNDTSRIESVVWVFQNGTPPSSNEFYPTNILFSEPGTNIYSVTVSNICGTDIAIDTFVIDTIPVLVMGPTDTICITDGIFQVPEPFPAGGYWTGSPAITPAGLFDPVIAGGGVITIEYVYTVGACMISGFKDIYVVDLSYVNGGPPVSTCISEDSIILNGGTPIGGWYTGLGITDTVNGIFSPSSLIAGNYIITYHYQLPNTDCIGLDTFIVYVHPLPIPVISITDSICIHVPVVFNNLSSGASSYIWYVSDSTMYTDVNPVHTFQDTGLFTVTLVAISEFGCIDSTSTQVYVSGPPVAGFTLDPTMGCAILPVNFNNTSTGFAFAQYFWDFGYNNITSTLVQPNTVNYGQGLSDTTYFITLVVTNHCGTDFYSDSVIVFPQPTAVMDISKDLGCTPLNVEFNNLSYGLPDSFVWYINGILYSTDSIPPARIFTADSTINVTYSIQLVVLNECGADTTTRLIIVKPNDVRAFFSADQYMGCEPLTINFVNSTSPDSLITYNWYFGDGETSQEEDPVHTFYSTGDTITVYTVTLVANNGCGSDDISIEFEVYPEPDVSFSAVDITCAEDTVVFTNNSIDVVGSVWNFGDGTAEVTATNASHVFQSPGTYTVLLTAFAATTGCPSTFSKSIVVRGIPQPELTASPLFGCPPLKVNITNLTTDADYYIWDFGDGQTSVGANPGMHTYYESGTFQIMLTASDIYGCDNDTVFSSILVYPVPIADFEIVQDQPCGLPQSICLNNLTTGAFGFNWNYTTGTSVDNSPCISYNNAGTYPISLIAQNQFLCADTVAKNFTAYGVPIADFSVSDTSGCEDFGVQFTNLSQNAEYVKWIFHNGIDTTRNPSRIYPDTGYYGVTLIAWNGSGCGDTLSIDSLLHVYPSPMAGITFDILDAELPTTYQFYDSSSLDVTGFYWNFGDGYDSEQMDPKHRFLSSYDKTIFHIVANMYGCKDTAYVNIDLDTLSGLFIPNILEPENSAIKEHNIFLPKGIGLSEYSIAIYARNGQLVWESNALDAEGMPSEFWDGTYLNQPLPSGVFVWKVHTARFINGTSWDGMEDEKGKLRRSGFLYLVR
jgi:PKD repeat protein